jgi:hypothetical protein
MGRLESQSVIWRMGLKPRQRETWNSPATICKRCPEVRKAIEEANKNRPPRQPRPRPGVNPADELERTINRVFDLLDALKDVDLRRQQIERLTTLLSELSEKEMAAEGSVEAVLAAFDALLVALKKKTALERHQIVNPLLEDLGDRLLEAHADDDNTLQEHWEREWDERRRKRAAAKRAANKAKREAAAKAQQEAEG